MSEQRRTITFVAVAGVMLLMSAVTYSVNQPAKSDGFEMVGKEFFEEFEGSSQAGSLDVYAIDSDSATLKEFRVEEKDGIWSIPSHYGYPAEASDRLAKTSSSLIGLTRESLVGRLKADHERFGVVDPLSEDSVDPDSAGKRITIKDNDGEVLVDLIIGKEAEGEVATDEQLAFGQENTKKNYYVRRPDESQTYKVAMDLSLSTKFSDWIRPDLLDMDSSEVRQVVIDNYELVEESDPLGRVARIYKKQGDQMAFERESGFGPWDFGGLNEQTQELDSGKIDTAVSTLDNLKIVGVRKKTSYKDQQLLNPDLTLNEIDELKDNIPLFREIMGQFQQEMSEYGFNLAPAGQDTQKLTIVSNAGQMSAGTESGVVYTLQFGNPISGEEDDIEIGVIKSGNNDKPKQKQPAEDLDAGESADGSGEKTGESEKSDEEIKNRFLMIRVAFDENLLGEKPVKPTAPEEPVKPEGYVEAAVADAESSPNSDTTEDETAAQKSGDENQEDNENLEIEDTESKDDSPADDRPQEFKDYDVAIENYGQQKADYELKLTEFNDQKEEFDSKVEEGKKLVDELNQRFGKWFYVISADNLESLQLKKEDLVSDKPKVELQGNGDNPLELPERPNLDLGLEDDDAPEEPTQKSENKSSEEKSDPNMEENPQPDETPVDDGKNQTNESTKTDEQKPLEPDSNAEEQETDKASTEDTADEESPDSDPPK